MAFDPYTAGAGLLLQGVDLGLDWLAGEEKERQAKRAAAALQRSIDNAEGIYTSGAQKQSAMYDPYVAQGLEAWGNLPGLQEELRADKFKLPELGEFEYDKTVEDFLDPSMQFQIDQGTRAIEGSAAGSGGLYSGKTLKDLTKFSQGVASQEYGEAYDRFVNDKKFAYGNFMDKFNTQRANIQDKYTKLADNYGRIAGISDVGRNAVGAQAGIQGTLTGQRGDLAIQRGNVEAQRAQIPGTWQRLAGMSEGIGNLVSGGMNFATGMMTPSPTSTGFTPQMPVMNPNVGNYGMNASYGQGGYMNQPFINPYTGGQ